MVVVALSENPWPGNDGITTRKPFTALPPRAAEFVRRSTIFSSSMTEPGHSCVTINGNWFTHFERTWMMNVQHIDLSDELVQTIEFRLVPAPIVTCRLMVHEFWIVVSCAWCACVIVFRSGHSRVYVPATR